MTNHPWDDANPVNENEIQPTEPEQAAAPCGNCQCPYGQPAPMPNRGSRILVGILIGLAAAFVIGFGSYAVFLSVQQNLGGSGDANGVQQETTSSVGNGTETPAEENPVGVGTDADFAGLAFAKQVESSLSAKSLYRALEPSVAAVTVQDGGDTYAASGIILTKDGYLLTTAHAIGYSRSSNVMVTTSDGREQKAVVVGYDSSADVAVLKIDRDDLTPATLAKANTVAVGDPVYAVVTADGELFTGVLTRGIVSAQERNISYDGVSGVGFLQTDAAIGVNGSGGALVNGAGQVVGLAISNSYLGDGYAGESYAIPIEQVRSIVEDIIRQGYVSGKVRLGITGTGLTKAEAKSYGIPQGVVIVEIAADSSFRDADVKVGDIITALDGTAITGMEDVAPILKKHKAGDQLEVELYRMEDSGDGSSFTVTVTLLDDAGQTQK